MKRSYIILIILLTTFGLQAQQIEMSKQGTFALTNATIETVTNGTQSGTLLIRDGKIAAIGANVSIPTDATTIDCSGHSIYPGMIDSGTQLGLSEVGSISLTQDYREIGDIIPHMQALTAVNPNAVAIPVTRVEGITTVLSMPAGGLFPGTASLINLHGYTPDQMYAGYQTVILNFPGTGRRGRWDRRSDEDIKKAAEKALKKLNDVWAEAQLYVKLEEAHKNGNGEAPAYYPEMATLAEVVAGNTNVMIEVNAAADIRSAIEWVKEKEVKNVVFSGVSEGFRVAEELAASGIPVITGPLFRTPSRGYDRYDAAYTNAGIMHKAGVKIAIRSGDSENVRNLPYNAGFAAAYGMGKEAALKAVTIVPAEIFGVADQLGSLEVGKTANLFVSTGDPFEPKTQIKYLFIDGWQVAMDSRHIRLYDEFLNRAPGLKKE